MLMLLALMMSCYGRYLLYRNEKHCIMSNGNSAIGMNRLGKYKIEK